MRGVEDVVVWLVTRMCHGETAGRVELPLLQGLVSADVHSFRRSPDSESSCTHWGT